MPYFQNTHMGVRYHQCTFPGCTFTGIQASTIRRHEVIHSASLEERKTLSCEQVWSLKHIFEPPFEVFLNSPPWPFLNCILRDHTCLELSSAIKLSPQSPTLSDTSKWSIMDRSGTGADSAELSSLAGPTWRNTSVSSTWASRMSESGESQRTKPSEKPPWPTRRTSLTQHDFLRVICANDIYQP